MDKYDLKDLMQYMATEMGGYSSIRTGGNLGTAIQGFLNLKGAEKIESGLNKIAKQLEKIAENMSVEPVISEELKEIKEI